MSDPAVRNTGIFETVTEDKLRAARSRSTTRSRALDAAREEAKQSAYAEAFELGQVAGYAEGFETGRQEAVARFTAELEVELEQITKEIQATFDQLTSAVESFYLDAEKQLAAVAKDVVARVLDAELNITEDAIIGIVRAAISEVAQSREVVVRLNTAHKPLLEANRESLLRAFSSIKSLEFISDPDITHGCIVEGSHGSVDATLNATLRLIEGEAA
ncbi:MAG: hypothetical protein JNK63_09465 [Chthonomonas sp.]|nr:hypothetical protein [Chthonomonas sp.]